ncbi:MAG: hypothetical protein PUA73_04820 [Bacilli bacterium]|nr:hypothetical protein [Bacilli bacterium]
MTIPTIIFILILILVVVFFKDFHAFVYSVVTIDIFLRIWTYLKLNIIKDTAFTFLSVIPSDVPAIINSFDLGFFNDILMFLYIIVYIVFEGFMISKFIHRKF